MKLTFVCFSCGNPTVFRGLMVRYFRRRQVKTNADIINSERRQSAQVFLTSNLSVLFNISPNNFPQFSTAKFPQLSFWFQLKFSFVELVWNWSSCHPKWRPWKILDSRTRPWDPATLNCSGFSSGWLLFRLNQLLKQPKRCPFSWNRRIFVALYRAKSQDILSTAIDSTKNCFSASIYLVFLFYFLCFALYQFLEI